MHTLNVYQLPPGWLAYPYTKYGYRVNYNWVMALQSIFYYDHNEFWMIWTEIMFMGCFSWLYADILCSDIYQGMYMLKKVTCNLMYLAAIVCRLCSLTYHIFNCVSSEMNRSLINIDLIGIATNALGIPWVACLYFDKHHIESLFVKCLFAAYFLLLFLMYLDTNIYYIKSYMRRNYVITHNLLSLYLTSNIITGMVIFDVLQSNIIRLYLLQAQGYMFTGYILFYTLRFPECSFGYSKIMNSHLLWHVFTFIGQYCFVATVYLQ